MGSSAKKKREKQKDFQKPKLKVGKAKAKPDNHTDIRFQSKSIVVREQSLHYAAPTTSAQFAHALALLSSRSDVQRREALNAVTTALTSRSSDETLPLPAPLLLPKILPLALDASAGIRGQVLRILEALPVNTVRDHVSTILLYIRAGMTHLSADIRRSSLDLLAQVLNAAGDAVVAAAGGWTKTLACFAALLGWSSSAPSSDAVNWSQTKVTLEPTGAQGKSMAHALTVLARLLHLGLVDANESDGEGKRSTFPYWHTSAHMLPVRSHAYSSLGLFETDLDDGHDILDDREMRLRVFRGSFDLVFRKALGEARNAGGEVGRAAGLSLKVLQDSDRIISV